MHIFLPTNIRLHIPTLLNSAIAEAIITTTEIAQPIFHLDHQRA
jgi:hypothetical protein